MFSISVSTFPTVYLCVCVCVAGGCSWLMKDTEVDLRFSVLSFIYLHFAFSLSYSLQLSQSLNHNHAKAISLTCTCRHKHALRWHTSPLQPPYVTQICHVHTRQRCNHLELFVDRTKITLQSQKQEAESTLLPADIVTNTFFTAACWSVVLQCHHLASSLHTPYFAYISSYARFDVCLDMTH